VRCCKVAFTGQQGSLLVAREPRPSMEGQLWLRCRREHKPEKNSPTMEAAATVAPVTVTHKTKTYSVLYAIERFAHWRVVEVAVQLPIGKTYGAQITEKIVDQQSF